MQIVEFIDFFQYFFYNTYQTLKIHDPSGLRRGCLKNAPTVNRPLPMRSTDVVEVRQSWCLF